LDTADRYFLRALGRLSEQERQTLRRSIRSQGEATFRSALRQQLGNVDALGEVILLEQAGTAVDVLARSGAVAQRFFSSRVEYLGPLREAPHVLYDPGPTQTDLGPRGEFAAAVLHAQAESRIVMPDIPGSPHGRRRPALVPLNQALNAWLQWFGLADEATSEDRGRLGIGLSVTPSALGRPVDLTSVGVGVSQVLPVVLLCLLARPGTLVVLEQPELHLQPRLQQDLADFLLACVGSGRQLVIETHSEHLVNRLRRRVAADETDQTRELVKLVFAENTDGITTYRESSVNRFGGLDEDWPDGFLDLGARESRALIKESASKRRRDSGD
jgi:predicted ATPase